MAAIMTKSGGQDNIITYEHICDTTADMASIDPQYITLGSMCLITQGESGGTEAYIANSNKEWIEIVGGSSNNSGGGEDSGDKEEDDYTKPYQRVELIDYDGELVAGYTPDEFLALSAYPEAPEHDGLTFDGWNWTLEEAKAYVRECGLLTVGAMYKPTDGYMHLKVHVYTSSSKNQVSFGIRCSEVIWGDGTTSPANSGFTHTYAEPGVYDIIAKVTDSGVTSFSSGSDYADIWEVVLSPVTASINKMFAGTGLRRIVIPNGVGISNAKSIFGGLPITGCVLPASGTFDTLWDGSFSGCNYLKREAFSPAQKIKTGSTTLFAGCGSLISFAFPHESAFTNATAMFASCSSLKGVAIPSDVTGSFGGGSFGGTYSLDALILHPGISLEQGAAASIGARYLKTGPRPGGTETNQGNMQNQTRLKKADIYGVSWISAGTINNSNAEEVNFELIGNATGSSGAISYSSGLKRLTFTGNLNTVNSGFIESCPNLEELIFDDGPTNFDNAGSVNAPGLKKVVFPSTIQSISDAFFGTSYMPRCTLYCPWSEGEVAGAPWGAIDATVVYNYSPENE